MRGRSNPSELRGGNIDRHRHMPAAGPELAGQGAGLFKHPAPSSRMLPFSGNGDELIGPHRPSSGCVQRRASAFTAHQTAHRRSVAGRPPGSPLSAPEPPAQGHVEVELTLDARAGLTGHKADPLAAAGLASYMAVSACLKLLGILSVSGIQLHRWSPTASSGAPSIPSEALSPAHAGRTSAPARSSMQSRKMTNCPHQIGPPHLE